MKLLSRIFMLFTLPLLLVCLSGQAEAAALDTRALWISSVYNLDYPSRTGLSAWELQAEADEIIAYASRTHVTDLFLQVRSCGDALYASEIFPWSQYLSGQAGAAPDGDFDPLAYFVQAGHAASIRIHAWINPYMLTRQKTDSREAAFALLPAHHPAREIPDAVVHHTNGRLYLDPGHPDARNLILQGITEILDNYAVDGIHFDDYFYPGTDFNDAATYQAFGGGLSLDSFRRQSVNTLIAQVYTAVHQRSGDILFGVSPSGIWANESSHALGSATGGQQSYYAMYADSRKWIKDAMVDYLAPQIYWHTGHESADFVTLANWWNDVAADTGVKLYLGLGAYRMEETDRDPAWEGTDEIQRQLALCRELEHISGVALYRYESCAKNQDLTSLLTQIFAEEGQTQAEKDRFDLWFDGLHEKKLTLLSPSASVVGEAGGTLELFAAAPRNSKVTAYHQGVSCTLTGEGGEYSGSLSLSTQPSAAPILLVSEKAGMLQIALSPGIVTVPDKVASVKAFHHADTDNSHSATIILDAPCNAEALLQENTVTLTLSPCRLAPLLEDAFFLKQEVTQTGSVCIYTFTVPDTVAALRTEWADYRLRLIFTLHHTAS